MLKEIHKRPPIVLLGYTMAQFSFYDYALLLSFAFFRITGLREFSLQREIWVQPLINKNAYALRLFHLYLWLVFKKGTGGKSIEYSDTLKTS